MEVVYELISPDHSRPVLVAPLGEYLQSRWVKAKEHHAPSVSEVQARDMSAIVNSKRFGHAPPQHTGFAMEAFAARRVQPCDLPDSIPGVNIALDREAKRVRIFDPLETLPNRKEIEATFLAVFHKYRVPKPEVIYDRLSESDLDVWQAWLDAAVANGTAERVVKAAQPEPIPEVVQEQVQEQPVEPAKEPVVEPVPEPTQPAVVAPEAKPAKAHGRRRTSA